MLSLLLKFLLYGIFINFNSFETKNFMTKRKLSSCFCRSIRLGLHKFNYRHYHSFNKDTTGNNKSCFCKPYQNKFQLEMTKTNKSDKMYGLVETNHKNLIDNLRRRGIIDDEEVYDTMLQVDRGNYIKENPYVDTPVYISHGVTISAPHMHALFLKKLLSVLKPGLRALDVGSGSGYFTACMAVRLKVLENKNSFVLGMDRLKELVDFSIQNIQRDKPELLKLDNFKIIHKNIYQLSEEEKKQLGVFDAIHVGASASELPEVLVDLLAEGGILIIPIQEHYSQVVFEIKKINGKIIKSRLFEVYFVALKKN